MGPCYLATPDTPNMEFQLRIMKSSSPFRISIRESFTILVSVNKNDLGVLIEQVKQVLTWIYKNRESPVDGNDCELEREKERERERTSPFYIEDSWSRLHVSTDQPRLRNSTNPAAKHSSFCIFILTKIANIKQQAGILSSKKGRISLFNNFWIAIVGRFDLCFRHEKSIDRTAQIICPTYVTWCRLRVSHSSYLHMTAETQSKARHEIQRHFSVLTLIESRS